MVLKSGTYKTLLGQLPCKSHFISPSNENNKTKTFFWWTEKKTQLYYIKALNIKGANINYDFSTFCYVLNSIGIQFKKKNYIAAVWCMEVNKLGFKIQNSHQIQVFFT